MKKFAVAMLLVAGLALTGCGSSNNNSGSGNVNGNWTAALTDMGGNAVLDFTTSLVVNSGGALAVSNFKFVANSSCFVSGETESGSFVFSGNFNGNVIGKFQFMVASENPAGNTLTLTGTANGNTISGTWMLVGGTGCSDNGNFTITKM